MILQIILSLIFCYIAWSFIEYFAHRWPMHSRVFVRRFSIFYKTFERHAMLHHGRYYKKFDDENDIAAKHISFEQSPVDNVIGALPFAFLIYFLNPLTAYIFISTAALHGIIWTIIHREMHEPRQRWFSKLFIYKFLLQNHKTHHEHPNSNFNAVFPLADFMFRTYRSKNANY